MPELKFKPTTHDESIYKAIFDRETIYLLSQVDDFATACTNQTLANKIYNFISKKIQLQKEDKVPFAKLGLIDDFNGIYLSQTDNYILLSYQVYIYRLITSHGWTENQKMKELSKPASPLSSTALSQIYAHKGPVDGTKDHKALEE